ncbi:MAG: hypothetical protein V4509_04100 [Patescibacteria group bacterium]
MSESARNLMESLPSNEDAKAVLEAVDKLNGILSDLNDSSERALSIAMFATHFNQSIYTIRDYAAVMPPASTTAEGSLILEKIGVAKRNLDKLDETLLNFSSGADQPAVESIQNLKRDAVAILEGIK